jgi:hypothetical protein
VTLAVYGLKLRRAHLSEEPLKATQFTSDRSVNLSAVNETAEGNIVKKMSYTGMYLGYS